MSKLDRSAMDRVLKSHTKSELARRWGIALPTIRRYFCGAEPGSRAVADAINADLATLVTHRPSVEEVLLLYCNAFANHRLSVNEARPGIDCEIYVMRFPVGELEQRYERTGNALFIACRPLNKWLTRNYPEACFALGDTDTIDLAQGVRLNKALRVCYRFDVSMMQRLKLLLLESASRSDPEQDGRL